MSGLLPWLVGFAFVFGAMVGSFLNVVIYRVPRGMSIACPKRSFCPACTGQIAWHQNIPLVSWIVLNGRCATCGAPIPVRYLGVELVTATLFALLAVNRLGGLAELSAGPLMLLAVDCTVASLLVAIAVIDFQHAIIPDPLTVPWIPLLVLAVWIWPEVLRGQALSPAGGRTDAVWPAAVLAGVALGALPALLVDFLRRRREPVEAGEEPSSALPEAGEEFSIWSEAAELSLPLLLPALAGALLLGWTLSGQDSSLLAARPSFSAALTSAAGAGAGLLFVYLIRFLFSALFRREAMGLGDAKFLGFTGALLGAEGSLMVFVLACALGSLPAFFGLLMKIPLATVALLLAALLPLMLMQPAALALSPGLALALLMPVPLIGLLLFFRHLKRTRVTLTAMPFGPFLVVAALVLLLAWSKFEALLDKLLAPVLGR